MSALIANESPSLEQLIHHRGRKSPLPLRWIPARSVEPLGNLTGRVSHFTQLGDATHQVLEVSQLCIGGDRANQWMARLVATRPLQRDVDVLAVRRDLDHPTFQQTPHDRLAILLGGLSTGP